MRGSGQFISCACGRARLRGALGADRHEREAQGLLGLADTAELFFVRLGRLGLEQRPELLHHRAEPLLPRRVQGAARERYDGQPEVLLQLLSRTCLLYTSDAADDL